MTKSNLQNFRWMSHRLPKSGIRRLVVITGARQTGKTTLARETYPELRYVSFDAPENREFVRAGEVYFGEKLSARQSSTKRKKSQNLVRAGAPAVEY